jgi:hypothetical protein
VVAVGSRVRIRGVRAADPCSLPHAAHNDIDSVVTITAPGDMGIDRLTTRTPLARALLGRQAGDTVAVRIGAGTAHFDVLAVEGGL